MKKYSYTYLQSVKNKDYTTHYTASNPGYKYRLRRNDGKLVMVSNRRLLKLDDEKRLKRKPY